MIRVAADNVPKSSDYGTPTSAKDYEYCFYKTIYSQLMVEFQLKAIATEEECDRALETSCQVQKIYYTKCFKWYLREYNKNSLMHLKLQ
ncbi:hypothetical protein [Desmonostoc muscorum]|nr:hypothetical protein [Desmonostoc muscorum]